MEYSKEGEGAAIATLPVEIILRIFGLLDVETLFKVPLVCTQWLCLSLDDSIWMKRASEIRSTMDKMKAQPELAKRFLASCIQRLKRGGFSTLECLRDVLNDSNVLHFFDPGEYASESSKQSLSLKKLGRCTGYDSAERIEAWLMVCGEDVKTRGLESIILKSRHGTAEYPIELDNDEEEGRKVEGWVFLRVIERKVAQRIVVVTPKDTLQVVRWVEGREVGFDLLLTSSGNALKEDDSHHRDQKEVDEGSATQLGKRRHSSTETSTTTKRKRLKIDAKEGELALVMTLCVKNVSAGYEEQEVFGALTALLRKTAAATGCLLKL